MRDYHHECSNCQYHIATFNPHQAWKQEKKRQKLIKEGKMSPNQQMNSVSISVKQKRQNTDSKEKLTVNSKVQQNSLPTSRQHSTQASRYITTESGHSLEP
jgi:hypothetical protein